MLDSTAATSSVDPGRLSALGIPAARSPVLNLNGVDLAFSLLPAMVNDGFATSIGRVYQGTLGNDFFQRVVVEIDYARQTLRLYDPAMYTYSGEGMALHLTFADGLPVVSAKFTDLKGKVLEGQFVISTVLDASTVVFDRYAESHHIFSSHWKTIRSVDPALSGSGGSVVGRLKGMQLGRFTAQDTLVTFSRSDLPGASDSHIAGVIGTGLLSRFTVIFDYPHQQLIIAPNSRFQSDDQEDKSGISVVAKGSTLKTFEIVDLNPGSPAAKAGIQKGDVIEGIDEDAAADLTLAEIRELFREVGHKYTLVIDRNGQTKQITIEMRRQI
jgi:PDZ domain